MSNFFALPFFFLASSSANFSLTGVSVNISDCLFLLFFLVPFLEPAFGSGHKADGLNSAFELVHGCSIEAGSLQSIPVLLTIPKATQFSEEKEGIFIPLSLASKQ